MNMIDDPTCSLIFIRANLSADLLNVLDTYHHHGELYSFINSMRKDDTFSKLAKLMLASGKWSVGESFPGSLKEAYQKIAIMPEFDGSSTYCLMPYDERQQKPVQLSEGSFAWITHSTSTE